MAIQGPSTFIAPSAEVGAELWLLYTQGVVKFSTKVGRDAANDAVEINIVPQNSEVFKTFFIFLNNSDVEGTPYNQLGRPLVLKKSHRLILVDHINQWALMETRARSSGLFSFKKRTGPFWILLACHESIACANRQKFCFFSQKEAFCCLLWVSFKATQHYRPIIFHLKMPMHHRQKIQIQWLPLCDRRLSWCHLQISKYAFQRSFCALPACEIPRRQEHRRAPLYVAGHVYA